MDKSHFIVIGAGMSCMSPLAAVHALLMAELASKDLLGGVILFDSKPPELDLAKVAREWVPDVAKLYEISAPIEIPEDYVPEIAKKETAFERANRFSTKTAARKTRANGGWGPAR